MRRESRVLRRSLKAGKVYRETARKLSEIGEQVDSMRRSHDAGGQPRSDPQELEEPVVAQTYARAPVRERIKPKLWTPQDLASYLQVNVNWIYRRSPDGARDRIPHIRMGKLLRFDPESEDFKQWLQAHGKN